LLGLTLAGLHRTDEAVACWEKAVEYDPQNGYAWRLLGLHHWKKDKDLEKAEVCYEKAHKTLPDDQIVLRDLTEVLTALKRVPEAIKLAEAMPQDLLKRYDLGLWLAKSYLAEKRYDDCINFLTEARFSNWEGVTTPRDTWASALVERGKLRLEAGKNNEALADFQTALTYPANLGVGQRYKRTDAETCFWTGKALQSLGRKDEARKIWQEGALQISKTDPPATFIAVTPEQDEHVKKCKEALDSANK
jgi:tetratricopeptide (TPR) repeat protein